MHVLRLTAKSPTNSIQIFCNIGEDMKRLGIWSLAQRFLKKSNHVGKSIGY